MSTKLSHAEFMRQARAHQVQYRKCCNWAAADKASVRKEDIESCLSRNDALAGRNFIDHDEVRKALLKHFTKYQPLTYNMLRSQHIPYNLFGPLGDAAGKSCLAKALDRLLKLDIKAVTEIMIEYAPSPSRNYLNDRTAFDVFVACTKKDGTSLAVGIEVKYTEGAYSCGTKEGRNPIYNRVAKECGLYLSDPDGDLKQGRLRQLWRNQLLGVKLLEVQKDKYKDFCSVLLYPEKNDYIRETVEKYQKLLTDKGKKLFCVVTYEQYLDALTDAYKAMSGDGTWVQQVRDRYIFQPEH